MQAVLHTTGRSGAARLRLVASVMYEDASRIGQVFRLNDRKLRQVERAEVASKDEGVFLLCVSRERAGQIANDMHVPQTEGEYRNLMVAEESSGSTVKCYVQHDGETGNGVKFGPALWSERVGGFGSKLMEGFVEAADRYYVGVSPSQALKEMRVQTL